MTGRDEVFNKAMSDGHSAAWDQAWEKAAAFYQRALDEFPNNPKALNSLGLALYELDSLEDSLGAYQRASRVSPEDPLPLERIAQLSERLGRIILAVQAAMQAADLHIKNKNVEKAIENWLRVTQLSPDNATAHSNLALVYNKLGRSDQAIQEYLALASLLQRSGKPDKAFEMVSRSLALDPNHVEARQAASLLKSGQLLPQPLRPKGGTGPLRMANIRKMETPVPDKDGQDPISEARSKALTKLAELLFEFSDEAGETVQPVRRDLKAIVRGTGPLLLQKGDSNQILVHLGQAIDAQTHQKDVQAADELEKALEAGFSDSALYYDLGMLHAQGDKLESALQYLGHSVKQNDYALGARLLMGQTLRKMDKVNEACVEYLEALKLADSLVVPTDQAETIRQLYEPLIEAQAQEKDPAGQNRICTVVEELLNRPDWKSQVEKGRAQLPETVEGSTPLPLAEILTQTRSSQVIEAMGNVRKLMDEGYLRSAMEEAYHSIQFAPTYLPLHTLIGELLIKEEKLPDAISKLSVLAHIYGVRGESGQATKMLRQVIQLSPMDLPSRSLLIDQLVARGQSEDALKEYLELAELYYRQADLDQARKTYTTALRFCQQANVNSDWNVRILRNMADIDMQHMDWRQACRLFEQIRTIHPDDREARQNIIELNLRLGQPIQANDEVEKYISHLDSAGRRSEALAMLEGLRDEYPQQAVLRRSLAEEYRLAARKNDAVAELDALGKISLDQGDTKGAIQAIETIVSIGPPNLERYRLALANLKRVP